VHWHGVKDVKLLPVFFGLLGPVHAGDGTNGLALLKLVAEVNILMFVQPNKNSRASVTWLLGSAARDTSRVTD
jgi:hypothetical protein